MKKWFTSVKTFVVLSTAVWAQLQAQSNVFDNIIAPSAVHNHLETALIQAGLDDDLQTLGNITVFAPTDQAFDNLAAQLNTDINGLLALPNLEDILLYHVLNLRLPAANINNGDTPTPLFAGNSIKVTKTSGGAVYANQALVTTADASADNGFVHITDAVILPNETVVDVALDNGFTSLATAVITAELLPALTDPFSDITVFAPDNAAFDALATALGTDINGVLASPDLADILTYHVLATNVNAAAINNGDTPVPLNTANSLKLTKKANGDVFINQAQVTIADITDASNGIVHAIDAVVLPNKTVVDVALENGFTSLATAVITAELLPALTDPFSDLTVFAPDNAAFDDLATALGTDLNGVLASPDLADILTYHVLGSNVAAAAINNGDTPLPLNAANTLKLTKRANGDVYINHAQVTGADITDATNGIVHAINAVVLPNETVVDVAIDNGLTTLTTAVITAELLPLLTNPYATFTVFAPTNAAFDNLATILNTDLNGVLATPGLDGLLAYHVLDTEVNSAAINNGAEATPLNTFNSIKLTKTANNEVFANHARVNTADITDASNGIVHTIEEVIVPNKTVVDAILENGYTTLATAAIEAELLPALTNPWQLITVFAPNNAAFDQLASDLGTDLNGVLALPNLRDVLLYHVIAGEELSNTLTNGTLTALNGQDLTVNVDNGVQINTATVIEADLITDNGTVHGIDEVLLATASGMKENEINTIDVYPNPAQNTITLSGIEGTYEVIDINGKKVATGTTNYQKIDVSALYPGVYLLFVKDADKNYQAKFIKE